MPPGAPFRSFILPYPIRIDEFTELPSTRESNDPIPANAKLHFLTHTHSDHVLGLQAKSFAQKVYCSQDAKEMLLRIEELQERSLRDKSYRAEPTRKYRHLEVDPIYDSKGICINEPQVRHLLAPCTMNSPFKVEYAEGEEVVITAIDANHCPGSVMYLIEGSKGSVLHTGDFRAEPWFLESTKRNPFLQPYLASEDSPLQENGIIRTLEAIYLDTACVMQTHRVPSKESASSGLISLMRLYPPTTLFFINAWTLGYEDILKAIARAFGSKVHLDRYKHNNYAHLQNDPLLTSIGTSDPESTRFHACERFDRCHVVNPQQGEVSNRTKDNRPLVYINPVSSMTPELWAEYQSDTRARLGSTRADPSCLLVPLSRHSPLPELRSFVSLFRPKRIIPNTLDPKLKGLDWLGIERAFADCLASQSKSQQPLIPLPPPIDAQIAEEMLKYISQQQNDVEEDDTALKNLVDSTVTSSIVPGSLDARDNAKQWVVSLGYDPSRQGRKLKGKMGRKVALVMKWLGKGDDEVLARLAPSSARQREREHAATKALGKHYRDFDYDEENDSTEGEDEVHVKVHRQIFGNNCMLRRLSFISNAEDLSQVDTEAELTEPEQGLCPAISPLRPRRGGLEPLTPGLDSSAVAGIALPRYPRQKKRNEEGVAFTEPPMHTVAAMGDLDIQEEVEGGVATPKRGIKRIGSKVDDVKRPDKRMTTSSQKDFGVASFLSQNRRKTGVEDDPRPKSIKRPSSLFKGSSLSSSNLSPSFSTGTLLAPNTTNLLPVSFFTDNPMSPLKPNSTCPDLSPSPSRRLTARSRKPPLSPTSRLRKTQRRINMCAAMQASCSNLVDSSYEQQHIRMAERLKQESFKVESKLRYEQDRRTRFEALPQEDNDPSTDTRMDLTRRDEWIEKIKNDKESGRRISLPMIGRD